ncbi:DUF1223 domain-containing protein [Mucilaginibacter sabulilitoris]|uniref:DUF1223 domain-containing protein n=1 Tax=Mucilaginibacter sabulilitoris TaxID=1173583 RepID=A0ABZ0TNJ5_9SPHI|nr:DUF1223 domain-containing protein [Mucilaginibacter sabulilitoris]WPU94724.1 DUF1223 domain-containing protein [Mucilaginibacter sabulilitoris]
MKRLFLTIIISIGLFTLGAKAQSNTGFAVVELFTSEGCSSCPPADALIAKIQQENTGKPVYVLAFHVDYWDRQGWKDRFSDHVFTERQQQYATWLHSNEVYTPQAIINGKTDFVGSEAVKMHSLIARELQHSNQESISLSDLVIGKGKINFKYNVVSPKRTKVVFVLVQKDAVSQVKSGENRGRTLGHVQIARSLASVDLNSSKTGTMQLGLPTGTDAGQFEVIAFVQNANNGVITAASKLSTNI